MVSHMRLHLLLSAAVAVAVTAPLGAARAQSSEVVVAPAPPPVSANVPEPDAELPRLDERTALTLGARKLKLGILAADYGITDRVNVGIDPPYWALHSVESIIVPNLHFKFVAVRHANLWVAANVAGYWANITKGDHSSGDLLSVPLSLFVSVRPTEDFWIHPEVTYIVVNAWGTGDLSKATFGGTAASRAVQLGLMFQYQLNRVVSFTAWGRVQAYTGSIAFNGSGDVDSSTTATLDARMTPSDLHPWAVVPGVALLWTHVRLTVGAGYGNYFLPGMDISIRGRGFVPDASLYVVL
jgi:hypothetical protein